MQISTERGQTFTRHALDVALRLNRGRDAIQEAKLARDEKIKAAVASGTTADSAWAGALVTPAPGGGEFVGLVRAQEVIGRLRLRRVPFATPVATQLGGGTYAWSTGGVTKVVSALQYDSATLPPRVASGIIVITESLARNRMRAAETAVRDELVAGVVGFTDRQFLNPTVSEVADISPASITNGAPNFASTGDPGEDLRQLLGAMLADLRTLLGVALVMGDDVAFAMATMLNPAGGPRFPNLGVDGGTVFGLPVVTSSAAADLIVGIHTPSVLLAEGDIGVDESTEATLQMRDDPVNGPAELVSMFQTNSVALRVDRVISWQSARTGAVRYVSDVEYAPES